VLIVQVPESALFATGNRNVLGTMLSDRELKSLIVQLLTTPSTRTKQRQIGASGIGNPCAYCLAQSLLGNKSSSTPRYWLGARIGTAIHQALEDEAKPHVINPEPGFEAFQGASLEESIYIGTIPGYGDIFSTPDLYLAAENHLVDYKTSKRVKTDEYVITGDLPVQYLFQVQLYARALEDMGKPVDKISFLFINRDGVGDRDVIVISIDYDRGLADQAWDRVCFAWEWLTAGNDPESLESDSNCFVCHVLTGRV